MSGSSRVWLCGFLGLFLFGCPAPEIPASFFTVESQDIETGNEGADGESSAPDVNGEDVLVQDAATVDEDAQDAEVEEKDTQKPDEPECTTIQDCLADGEANPCLQPSCTAGICGELPVPVGTECPLPEGMSETCATAACNSVGECVPTFEAEGTSCAEVGAIEQCSSTACNGEGVCETNSINEGQRCGSEENCLLSFCAAGACVQSPDLCEDQIGCTRNECREVLCSDDTLEECELNLRIQKDDGTLVEGTGALVCVPVPRSIPMHPLVKISAVVMVPRLAILAGATMPALARGTVVRMSANTVEN